MKVVVIGSGIVGSAIAFHLASLGMAVEVWEALPQAGLGATGAALGILMAVSSAKTKGKTAQLRLDSLAIYEQWLPLLERMTGRKVLRHRGIFCVPHDRALWQQLSGVRAAQGYPLQPQSVWGLEGFFSAADRVVHPLNLLWALIESAALLGAKFHWGRKLVRGEVPPADRVVISSGLGSSSLVNLPLQAVGGQCVTVEAKHLEGLPATHIVDDLGDFNIVPLGNSRFSIGATVEFNPTVLPRAENERHLLDRAAVYLPQFQQAKVVESWANYRPRPIGRSAPVIEFLPDRSDWIVASGHYRNGILLAPITAQIVGEMIFSLA
ncbi:MAG: FAD-dependent oxidoreductase [Cyanobacteria bacterium M5B4]|nr:MAG: FAD-dependent oxidoreductase [Cyanobacteria bacterium M5B4]